MAPPTNRKKILAGFREQIKAGNPIIGAGAGIGLSAKSLEAGGVDLLILYNSGRFRMAGRGSLAGLLSYSNANDVVVEMSSEVLPIVKQTPVLAGVCGTDPFKDIPRFLAQLCGEEVVDPNGSRGGDGDDERRGGLGFAGVQNFPTVGLIDGTFRANLEETGMGYGLEVEMIREASRMGVLTAPYVFDAEQAAAMTEAGADIVVAHMGLTTSGTIGAQTGKTLEDCVVLIQEIRDAARKVSEDVVVLCHGGPIAEVDDARWILERCKGVDGFFGASSMERLPVEVGIKQTAEGFKGIKLA